MDYVDARDTLVFGIDFGARWESDRRTEFEGI